MENNSVHSVSVLFVSYPRKMASNDIRSSCLMTGRCIPEQRVPERSIWDFFIPWTTRPLYDACIPWSTRPLDDASLRNVSLNDMTRPFGPED
jgi:hypothetical protein